MCPPDHYDVSYQINPWMNTENKPNAILAKYQWTQLRTVLESLGAEITIIPPAPHLPDMVFTANAGFVFGQEVIISCFAKAERQPEENFFHTWFQNNLYGCFDFPQFNFEGQGDALLAGDILFCGFGHRSEFSIYPEIEKLFPFLKYIYIQLTDKRFYHLDTCFCPLNKDHALYYPGAMSGESILEMWKHIDLIPVPEEEAMRFACNAVVIGKDVVMQKDCPKTQNQLHKLGFSVHEVDLSEFIKSGGNAKCLSLIL